MSKIVVEQPGISTAIFASPMAFYIDLLFSLMVATETRAF
jgi:hypothetical protein